MVERFCRGAYVVGVDMSLFGLTGTAHLWRRRSSHSHAASQKPPSVPRLELIEARRVSGTLAAPCAGECGSDLVRGVDHGQGHTLEELLVQVEPGCNEAVITCNEMQVNVKLEATMRLYLLRTT